MIKSIEDGRKEDGNRSIADKIIKRLHDLDKTVENNQGRWAWELLQNAKDSIAEYEGRTLTVQIELFENKVVFRHNGLHFTEKDIRGLINQISSKEVEEGEQTKKTGRFGTGFLTTHLLSKNIDVEGIVETVDNEFYTFSFPLNREGKKTGDLIPKIETAWEQFHESSTLIDSDYNKDAFNTSFSYNLETAEQKEIAKIGTQEFIKLIPYVLTFIPEISKVEIIDHTLNDTIIFEKELYPFDSQLTEISKKQDGKTTTIHLLSKSSDGLAVAAMVDFVDGGYSFMDMSNIPKLFCDYPLIGTENFHFPVVVNSFYFNPQTERDGIWLKDKKDGEDPEVTENQKLLSDAVELYRELIETGVNGANFHNFFNICNTKIPSTNEKYFDEDWYEKKIQKPLRNIILNAEIVEVEGGTDKKKIADLWFPLKSYSKEVRDKIWEYNNDLFPSAICKQAHVHNWTDLSWDEWKKLSYAEFIKDLVNQKDIETLSTALGVDESEAYAWLTEVLKFVAKEDSNLTLLENNIVMPNRNGVFCLRKHLFHDEIKDDELLNILDLLGEDWKNILRHKDFLYGAYLSKDIKSIATEITEILKKSTNKHEDHIKAISLLSEWFEIHPTEGKEHFAELHRKRAELFMNTIEDKESLYKVMRSKTGLAELSKVAQALDDNPELLTSLTASEELSNLLKEFNSSSIEDLKKLLLAATAISGSQEKLEITEDVIMSLGVTNLEELEEALKDKDLAALLDHTSYPNVKSFLYVEGLIKRAKKNILAHLETLPNYDCSDAEDLAATVIGGIVKNGCEILVVIRPSDNGQVIVYYKSEKDSLDFENAELWIDDDLHEPMHLTLGKILKKTGIKKIPV